jgi:hypothetical protein
MSMVELPILTSQSLAGVKTAQNQVRIILRDISGKFCWEATALYNSEDSTMTNDDGSIDLPEWPPTVTSGSSTINSRQNQFNNMMSHQLQVIFIKFI